MLEDIVDIQQNLHNGIYSNEASVSQGIVQRILNRLDWPVYNPSIVFPEFSLDGRRVDYALCYPSSKPKVFIEVKKVGHLDGAEKQLFEYAFHSGVPIAVITDGNTWEFFLPSGQGSYKDRRFYKLDFSERTPAEIKERLYRYLGYTNVCSNNSLQYAQADYADVAQKRETKGTIPEAWAKLVEDGDDILIELLSDKVAQICGYKPAVDDVLGFINGLVPNPGINVLPPPIPKPGNPVITPVTPPGTANPTEYYQIFFNGHTYKERVLKQALITSLKLFANYNSNFLYKFASLPKHGSTRRFIAKDRNELYKNRPDLVADQSEEFLPGWWVGTNVGYNQVVRILSLSCEVQGIRFGNEFKLIPPK